MDSQPRSGGGAGTDQKESVVHQRLAARVPNQVATTSSRWWRRWRWWCGLTWRLLTKVGDDGLDAHFEDGGRWRGDGIVVQSKGLEPEKLAHLARQLLDPVAIQGQLLEVHQVAQLRRQPGDAVVGEVEPVELLEPQYSVGYRGEPVVAQQEACDVVKEREPFADEGEAHVAQVQPVPAVGLPAKGHQGALAAGALALLQVSLFVQDQLMLLLLFQLFACPKRKEGHHSQSSVGWVGSSVGQEGGGQGGRHGPWWKSGLISPPRRRAR